MLVYRITQEQFANDLSGYGSFLYGGRWNFKGENMLYAAKNPSLALFETLAHYEAMIVPSDLVLITIDIGETIFDSINLNALPLDWRNSPSPGSLKKLGSAFLKSKYPMMQVPSVVMPYDSNFLINPSHPDIISLKIVEIQSFLMDYRIAKG
jgi:RES domain-containing protein